MMHTNEELKQLLQMPFAILGNPCIEMCCKYCIYDDGEDCKTTTDTCQNGIKKWLEQE